MHFKIFLYFLEQVPRPPWQNSTKSPRILEKEYIGMLGNTQRNEKKYDRNNNKTNKHQRSKSVPTTLTKSVRSKSGLHLSVFINYLFMYLFKRIVIHVK